MISQEHMLLKRISLCLRLDKEDYSYMHVEIDTLISYLMEYDINVPPMQYEQLVHKFMKQRVLNKIELGEPGVIYGIAQGLLQLAMNLVQAAEISTFSNKNSETDDIKKILVDNAKLNNESSDS